MPVTAARRRHLAVAPDPADVLRADIRAICRQVDVRLGNPPGTAERGLYFHLWPPQGVTNVDVLVELHRDAVKFLCDLVVNGRLC